MSQHKSFYNYLLNRRKGNSPVSDLAKDILRDSTFPKDCDSLAELRTHMSNARACDEARRAAAPLWAAYIRQLNERK